MIMRNNAFDTGGGVCNKGTLTIPESVQLYNNHAGVAGDDIQNVGTITFGATGIDWGLDGDPDCTDDIDTWYLDGTDARWQAHADAEAGEENYVVRFAPGTVTSAVDEPLSLKAAHGLIVDYVFVTDGPDGPGGEPSPDSVETGEPYTAKTVDQPEGWTFSGWFVDRELTTPYEDGTEITDNMTLYGMWTLHEEDEHPGIGEPEDPDNPAGPGNGGNGPSAATDKGVNAIAQTSDPVAPFAAGLGLTIMAAGAGLVALRRTRA